MLLNRNESALWASRCISSLQNDDEPKARLLCAKAYVKLAEAAYPEVVTGWREQGEQLICSALEILKEFAAPEHWFSLAQIVRDIGNIYMRVDGIRGSRWDNSWIRDEFYRNAERFYAVAKSRCLPRLKTSEWKDALDIAISIIHKENVIQYRSSSVNDDIVERSVFDDFIREALACIKAHIQHLPNPQKYSRFYAELCCNSADFYGSRINEFRPYNYVFTYEEAMELHSILSEWDKWSKRGITAYQRLCSANRSPKNLETMCEIITNRILLLKCFRPYSIESIEAKFRGLGGLEEYLQHDEEKRQKEKLDLLIQAAEIFDELVKLLKELLASTQTPPPDTAYCC